MRNYLLLPILLFSLTFAALAAPPEPTAPAAAALSGTVVETMDSGGYSYINLKTASGKLWVAVPAMTIQVGQHLELAPGMEMGGFHSNSLNRTFDQIIFSPGPLQKKDGVPAGNLSPGHGSIQQPPAAPAQVIKVEKATGKNAYTVAELHGMRATLSGKKVLVRGKVVKVSQGIMGRNWVHLQDGSGSATDGSNDIVVTTAEVPTVGSLVTMTGTLAKDRDFGGGYRYKAIVEEGALKK